MQVLRSALDFLGGPGPVLLAIGLLFATPVIDRLFVRRKRLGFRVLYNSKIGLGPERLHDGTEPNSPQLRELVRVLDRMSIVVVRVRNTGSYDIDAEDFDKPLTFTFGDRVVWNARVSEAGSEEMKAEIRRSLQFFGSDSGSGAGAEVGPAKASLPTVRERMAQRVARWGGLAVPVEPPGEPVWHGVRLEKLVLRRKQKFKLLVVLREPDTNRDGELGKDVKVVGSLGGTGIVHDERPERLVTLSRLTGGLAALLAAVLVLVLAWPPGSTDATVACATGKVRVEGSSVFMPTMAAIAEQYERACPGAEITTTATGSIQGVREVAGGKEGEAVVALSDGKQEVRGVFAQQVAIVVYHVVVHSSVGLDAITVEQLRGIYAGAYTDWSQLRGGASLPIRIVGRGGESGTRELFERRVLGGSESALSSNDCRVKDRAPEAPVIRCERDENADVVREVGAVEGAIGYADAPSVAEARKTNALTALALDGKVFDAAAGVEAGYPFWTVEYLYTRSEPAGESLVGRFVGYVREHDGARVRMKDAGYLPCLSADRVPVDLCNLR
ncbi:ABC-type phosphate transport system substrate-binding protein [Saccharothrix saharensis]|uniref:ABC-type phosphate transport system substrate-binding protein n=1 Tax=Saccharothrix saharensis TaxID=571190 RepID=A0A543JKQ7_9PSEU|nr:substrate-binding domain-containing protein [Saccharothrix saharensis]TQM83429.1 ABC-type phosphate transport system substrate-binding protein [Saccharothrix saharensis]